MLKMSGSFISFETDVFGSIEDLRAVTALSHRTVLNRALDEPSFCAAP